LLAGLFNAEAAEELKASTLFSSLRPLRPLRSLR
jgi:hypothetical protein